MSSSIKTLDVLEHYREHLAGHECGLAHVCGCDLAVVLFLFETRARANALILLTELPKLILFHSMRKYFVARGNLALTGG